MSMLRFVGMLLVVVVVVESVPVLEPVPGNEEGGSDRPIQEAGFFGGDMAGFDINDFRNAVNQQYRKWPGAVVPYVIDASLNNVRNMITSAMDHYRQYTCVNFRPRSNEQDYIYITLDQGCWSYVGRQGGRQVVSLGQGCHYRGTIIHELAHALGFWHEQNRPDRDDYITIYYQNIMSGQEHNFRKFPYGDVNLLGEAYDLTSVMQYGEYAFSKDGRSPTIKAKSGAYIYDAWQKNSLSASDQRRVHKLYGC